MAHQNMVFELGHGNAKLHSQVLMLLQLFCHSKPNGKVSFSARKEAPSTAPCFTYLQDRLSKHVRN